MKLELRFVLLSVIFHAVLGSLLWRQDEEQTESLVPPEIVEFDFSQKTLEVASVPVAEGKKAALSPKGLKRFLPQPDFNLNSDQNEPEVSDPQDPIQDQWKNPYAFGRELGTESRFAKEGGFHREVRRAIDSHLLFDSMLSEYNHFGEVKLKFAVDAEGRLIKDSLQALADDRVLKVRAVWALQAALEDGLPENLRPEPPGPHWLGARFFFSKDGSCFPLEGKNGPFLTFCRATGGRPKADNLLEEITSTDIVTEKVENPAARNGQPKEEQQIQFKLNFGYEKVAEYYRKKYRQETGFDPFLKEKRDPAWDL